MSDEKDWAREQEAYLREWLKRESEQHALKPVVTRILSTATWNVGAMDALKNESPAMAREMSAEMETGFSVLQTVLKFPPKYDFNAASLSSSTAVSTGAVVFETLISVRGPEYEAHSFPWITKSIGEYQALTKEQNRADEARRRVGELFPNLSERFKEAVDSYGVVSVGNTAAEEAAASAMRTFLYKLNGELIAKARKAEKEALTWQQIAERLVPEAGRPAFLAQDHVYHNLHSSLSNISKGRWKAYNLAENWTRFVDFVYVVCGEVLAEKPGP